ncbi:MAG: NADH-quinone oxidoreductase subunit A [Pseudomonadota bacterium]
MDELLSEYFPILVFLGIAVVLGLLAVLAAMIRGPQRAVRKTDPADDSEVNDAEVSDAEINDDENARIKFDARYLLISTLCIVFYGVIVYLFPWASNLAALSETAFWSMMAFLAVLIAGFAYAWKMGPLD